MEGLTIRKAAPADLDRIAELIAGEPGQEALAIAGCEEAARKFGMGLVRMPDSPQGWQHSTMAEMDGAAAGVIQSNQDERPFRPTIALALLALRTFGVGIVAVAGRQRARQRVQVDGAPGSYYISEIDVDPSLRNRGVGGALLEWAEEEARRLGYGAMSLSTTTINPARRLYERRGYRVVETKTDRLYERYTGIAGRHLMVKELH